MKIARFRRSVAAALAAAILSVFGMGAPGRIQVYAADKLLTLSMAKKSGLANSPEYEKLESQLALKEASLKQAVKSIKVKQKNMATFRWSPLLSFKFPEKPNLTEAYEFQFKPVQIQAEIDVLHHQLTDQVLAVDEKISNLYVDIVILEDKLEFQEKRLKAQEEALEKNRKKLIAGQASQGDVDAMEKTVGALKQSIANDQRSLGANKKKLSAAIGMDVSTGYRFENPMVEADIPRRNIPDLIQHTLDRDQNYYQVSMDATTALTSLRTNYSLMSSQYGGKMSYISGFVNQAISGQKIDEKAFKKKYEEFLEAIDAPWQGNFRILFIKIPKEWLKGELSGIRYVQDEPYALYEAALAYQDALMEKRNMKLTLTESVEDGYDNLVTMRNAYLSLKEQTEKEEKNLKADEVLNRMGELKFEEYKTSLETYEEVQMELYGALADYSKALYSFDRLTCGGISAYLETTGEELTAGAGGVSHVEEEAATGAYYYIEPIIQEQQFRLGISIPDDFDVEVTDFELWCDQTQIGSRTPVDQAIRHMSLTVERVNQVKLRFYRDGEFVDECEIDPDSLSGPIELVKGYVTEKEPDLNIGTYASETNNLTGMVTLELRPEAVEGIQYYRLKTREGKSLGDGSLIPIDKKFGYLSLIQKDMEELVIEFYGADSELKYKGSFDVINKKLRKDPEGT